MSGERRHPIVFTLTVFVLSLLSSTLCALVYIAVSHASLPPTDMAYGLSLGQLLADPFVQDIAPGYAALVALVMFPIALVCLWRRDLIRCGLFAVGLTIAYLVVCVPFTDDAVFLSPLVTVSALVFCRLTRREWFIGSTVPDRRPATRPRDTNPAVRARAFAKLLALGFVSPRDVVAWVDALIAAGPSPHECLIDASLAEGNRNDLIAALDGFATATGSQDTEAVASTVLAGLHSWFLGHPEDGPRIARALLAMAIARECPDRSAEGDMYGLEDQYELAANGIYGSRDDVDRDLRVFLARWATPSPLP